MASRQTHWLLYNLNLKTVTFYACVEQIGLYYQLPMTTDIPYAASSRVLIYFMFIIDKLNQ